MSFVALYVFMCTDFFLRTCPLILAAAMVKQAAGKAAGFSVFLLLLALFAPLELAMCRWMRTARFRKMVWILKISPICVISSLCNLLSCLDMLENVSYFAKSVVFAKYMFAHLMRCALSTLMALIVLVAAAIGEDVLALWLVLSFAVLMAVNVACIKLIANYIDPEFAFAGMHLLSVECWAFVRSLLRGGGGGDGPPLQRVHLRRRRDGDA